MRGGFELEVLAPRVAVELTGERALDVFWARIMTFNEVAVVGVHDAHQPGEIGSGARIEGVTEDGRFRRELGNGVGDSLRRRFKACRLNALNGFIH